MAASHIHKEGIYLIGFMGSGKTHWGKIWATENGMRFYDTDKMIEEDTGKTVAELFEQNGETFFREQESAMLRSLEKEQGCIISCGGGLPCFNDNMHWMNGHGTTVYLSASPEYIFGRVVHEKDKRPLLKNIHSTELLFYIGQKLKERELFYKQAKLILPVEELHNDTIQDIVLLAG